MLKADLLRDAIVKHQPWFSQNPDRLEVYVTSGKVIAGGSSSPSFSYSYELNVLAMDYPGDLDSLTIPVLGWARRHQPGLLLNPQQRQDGIRFDAEILNNDTADILFVIKANEMVIVTFGEDGKPQAMHRDEPAHAEMFPKDEKWSLILADGKTGSESVLSRGNEDV